MAVVVWVGRRGGPMRDSIGWIALLAVALPLSLACSYHPECQVDADCDIGSICEGRKCEPVACLAIYDPVCGVDGRTYGNECAARVAHVSVAHLGECGQFCGGIAGIVCPDGERCELTPGQCDVRDGSGVCEPIPDVCTEEYDPVCGCDRNTYSNDCHRKMARVQKDHDGECESSR
ncbi:MAG: hypothetical protein E2P01_04375 [Acidobacteria bacterium]|nr:MAG: hypothetical protein E2P01_04375 [Acidobacteriota bacterium]